jgi:hypothetical protein
VKVRLQHVKGHAGEEGNDGADGLANLGCGMSVVGEKDWEAMENIVRKTLDVKIVEEAALDSMKSAPETVTAASISDSDMNVRLVNYTSGRVADIGLSCRCMHNAYWILTI